MFISKIKKYTFNTKPIRTCLAAVLIISLLAIFKANTITYSEGNGGVLSTSFLCQDNPCDLALTGKPGYAYSTTVVGCVDSNINMLYCPLYDTIKVTCGTSDAIAFKNPGDTVLCNIAEDIHIKGGGTGYPVLISIYLLPDGIKGDPGPKGDKGDPGPEGKRGPEGPPGHTSWDVVFFGGAFGSFFVVSIFGVITFAIYKCKTQNNQPGLLAGEAPPAYSSI